MNLPVNVGNPREAGSILRLERSPGEGNANPPQYSCLGDPIGRRAYWVTVQGLAKSWIQLSRHARARTRTHTHTHTHTHNRIITFLVPLIQTETNLVGKGMEFHLYNPQINSP